jgi:hypothetical protein
MARGLAKDIEAEQRAIWKATLSSPADKKETLRVPQVHLPDVTGLTSAVASPAKNGQDYYGYESGEEPRGAESLSLIRSF